MESEGVAAEDPQVRHAQVARSILDAGSYVVLSTSDAAGAPWATPVWFAHEGYARILWLSWPGARHSLNLAQRAQLSMVVFDSTAPPSTGQGVYLGATAEPVTDPDAVVAALDLLSAKLVRHGGSAFRPSQVTGDARLRLYRAVVDDVWVLDPDSRYDERVAVHL